VRNVEVFEPCLHVTLRARLRRPHPVNRPPVRNGEHPRPALPFVRSEPLSGLPHLEKDLLQHFFALVAID